MKSYNTQTNGKNQVQPVVSIQYQDLMDRAKRRAIHIWELRYKKDFTFEEIAGIYKISKQRVNQILQTSKFLRDKRGGDTK